MAPEGGGIDTFRKGLGAAIQLYTVWRRDDLGYCISKSQGPVEVVRMLRYEAHQLEECVASFLSSGFKLEGL
jgi:hypothetical protein